MTDLYPLMQEKPQSFCSCEIRIFHFSDKKESKHIHTSRMKTQEFK